MVLARDEVQRPAHQPREDERAVVAHGSLDVGRAEPGRTGAQREPRRPCVLRLHGEQRADEVGRAGAAGAVQPLRRRPSRAKLAGRHRAIITRPPRGSAGGERSARGAGARDRPAARAGVGADDAVGHDASPVVAAAADREFCMEERGRDRHGHDRGPAEP